MHLALSEGNQKKGGRRVLLTEVFQLDFCDGSGMVGFLRTVDEIDRPDVVDVSILLLLPG